MKLWPAPLGSLVFVGALVSAPPDPQPRVAPTNFAPIAYFNKKCVYCHSKDGANFAAESLKKYTDKTLLDRLGEMTDENAKAPLTDPELSVLASWVRSLSKQEPWIGWTKQEGRKLTFEASTGATLTAKGKGRELTVSSSAGAWSLTLPSDVAVSEVTLTAKKGEKKTELSLSKAATTHQPARTVTHERATQWARFR